MNYNDTAGFFFSFLSLFFSFLTSASVAREGYSSYSWEEIIHPLGQSDSTVGFLVGISLTRIFHERDKTGLTIVNKMTAKAMNSSFVFGVQQALPN